MAGRQGQDLMRGILGMNVLQECWGQLVGVEQEHMTRICWPTPDLVWQEALQAVHTRQREDSARRVYIGQNASLVLLARQMVVVEVQSRGVGGLFEAMLQPERRGRIFPGVTIALCLMEVRDGCFLVAVCNEN